MKGKKIIVLLLALVLVLALAACNKGGGGAAAGGGATDEANAAAVGEYYMVNFASGADFWKGCFAGFERAAKKTGSTAIITGTPEADFAAEIDIFQQVVAKKPKGIAVTPLDPDAFIGPINDAIASGISIVCFDNDSVQSNRFAYLGTENASAGAVAAKYMAEQLGGQGEVGIVFFAGAQNQEERARGFEEYMIAYEPGIKVVQKVHGGDDETASSAAASSLITANPNIKGIFGVNAWMGQGVGNAIEEAGKVGQIVGVAFDTDPGVLDYVESGTLSASVAQGTQQMGYWSFQFLWAANTDGVVDNWKDLGLPPTPDKVDTGVTMVTKDLVPLFR